MPGPRSVVAKSALRLQAWRLSDHGLELAASHQIAAREYSPPLYRSYLVSVRRGDAVALLRGSGVTSVAAVADRPVNEWLPADLDTATAAVSDPALHPAGRPLAELLRDCLECHFATEVRIGQAGSLPPDVLAGDGIALSRPLT